jgi:hypothetical protein
MLWRRVDYKCRGCFAKWINANVNNGLFEPVNKAREITLVPLYHNPTLESKRLRVHRR